MQTILSAEFSIHYLLSMCNCILKTYYIGNLDP